MYGSPGIRNRSEVSLQVRDAPCFTLKANPYFLNSSAPCIPSNTDSSKIFEIHTVRPVNSDSW
jgi:hypothetical protein